MIFRVDKTQKFTTICNHHITDKSLTLKAKGLLTMILTFENNFEFNMQFLVNSSVDGVRSVRTGIAELEKFGYIEKRLVNNGNLKSSYEFTVFEIPKSEMKKDDLSYQSPICQKSTSRKVQEIEAKQDEQGVLSECQKSISSGCRKSTQINTNNIYIEEISKNGEINSELLQENFRKLSGSMYVQNVQMSLRKERLVVSDEDYKLMLKKFMSEMIGTGEYGLHIQKLRVRWFYWLRKKLAIKTGKRNDSLTPTQAIGPAYKKFTGYER